MNNIINKIKKCLDLSNSSNPNEAAAALRKAQELMDTHNISMEDVEMASVKEQTSKRKRKRILLYENVLMQTIGDVFGCEFYTCGDHIIYIGIDPNQQIASYAFEVLQRKMYKARTEYLTTISKRFKRQNRIAKADEYALGWAMGVYEACKKLPKRPVPGLVKQYMEELMKKPGFQEVDSYRRKGNTNHTDGNAGYIDGSQVQIGAGVDTNDLMPKQLQG